MSESISWSYQSWLSEHVKRAEHNAFLAIDRFAHTSTQNALIKTLLSSALDRDVCRMAIHLPLLVHFGIRGTLDGSVYDLASALTLLEAGIYTLDHIMDREVDGPLSELPHGAVLLGAVCLVSHLPHQVLLAASGSERKAASLLSLLAEGLARIGAGQFEDIATAFGAQAASSERIEFAVTMKTGERRALFATMAATLADAPPAQVKVYAEFGCALGIARQLRSDLADLFSAGSSRDLASRVVTLPLALYLERGNHSRAAEMERLLASASEQKEIQQQVCDRLRESGILREVIARIDRQCGIALGALDRAQPDEPAKTWLRNLALSTSVSLVR